MKDLRHALRMLRRNPTTAVIIILTLALCIGANTAIFSVVDATFLRPLPYPEPARLAQVVLHYKSGTAEGDTIGQTGRRWELVRDNASFIDSAVYSDSASGVNFSAAGTVQYVKQQRVGAGYFRVLGIQPLLGREFTKDEDRPGGPALAVLSYPLWHRVFHDDPAAIGKALLLRGETYTVIGVMPSNFSTSVPADLWTPLRPSRSGEGGGQNYTIVARLKPDVTWAQANAQLEAVGAPHIQAMHLRAGVSARMQLITLQQGEAQSIREPLLIVWAAVGFVLLIGCANVASLLLARSAARSREIATRLALGGGRSDIIRQFLTEALVLAVLGGTAGVLVAYAALAGLKALATTSYDVVQSAHLDARVLAATAVISTLVSVLAGIFPALEAGAVDIRNSLSEAGSRGVAGIRRRWSRKLLVVGEISLAVLLLVGAGLLLRTLTHLYQLRPGFDPSNLITASFSLQDARYATTQSVNQLFTAGLLRIRALPGVESAAAGLSLPYERALNDSFQRLDGPQASADELTSNLVYVTPGYFETLRIPLLRGRGIEPSDAAKSSAVAVVNEAFAKRFLSQQEAVGSHIGSSKQPETIVGVVADVQQSAGFGNFGPLAPVPTIYVPVSQLSDAFVTLVHGWISPNWIVRYAGAPSGVMQGIEGIATSLDPLIPIAKFRTVDQLRGAALASQRFQAILLASLAGLALLLATVGIYGLMSNSVAERRRELGIRLALGATVPRAIREATQPGVTLAIAGVAAGCLLAALSAKVLANLVWGVTTLDPLTYAAVALTLLLIATLASLIPALRITHLNPADTLREE